ncbi:MAG: RelA/SpoT family protein [Paracoccaceae bacterium]
MQVTRETASSFDAVDHCDSEDLFDLIRAANCEPRNFFDGGLWQGLDFSEYDMSKIHFDDAIVNGCTFRAGDVSPETEARCRSFQDNKFVEQNPESSARSPEGDPASGVDGLYELVRSYNPKCNEELLAKAYEFADRMHKGQFRHSGEPYMSHPLATAMILAGRNLDDATIVVALLHDTLEDTKATYDEIRDLFGDDIAELVDGVTKITNLQLSASSVLQSENFRKLLLAMSKDVRVLIVKLADRLHILQTIRAMRPDKQVQKAQEVMDFYGPLAGRLGLQWMRDELEDLAFKVLNPDARSSILRRFVTLQKDPSSDVPRLVKDIEAEFSREGIEAQVFGRAEKPYSIWRKMEKGSAPFSRISDVYTFDVVASTEQDCYRVQGALHRRWSAVPGTFKDYISQPKSNGYRGLHTVLSGRDGNRIRVRIQTRQMREVAGSGVAARWAYQDGVPLEDQNPFAVDPARWVGQLSERASDLDDSASFLEAVRLTAYEDSVFCFTPRGEVLKLPRGASCLDFAYAIHTEVGNRCVGIFVDKIRVPLWTRLKNGQSVEIIVVDGQHAQSTWLEIVTTKRARSAIRRALREQDRDRFIRLGRELVRVSFEHIGKKATDKAIATAAKRLEIAGSNEALAMIGSAELSARDFVASVYPDMQNSNDKDIPLSKAVLGLPAQTHFRLSDCCAPVPGERIIGITDRRGRVSVHRIDCFELQAFEKQPEIWLDTEWASGKHAPESPVTLELTVLSEANVFANLFTLIGEQGAKVLEVNMREERQGFAEFVVTIGVCHIDHLDAVVTVLEAETEVVSVFRQVKGRNLTLE